MRKFGLYIAICAALAIPNAMADIRVSNLDPYIYGSWTGGNLQTNDRTCVYQDDGNTRYRVTATDDSTITPSGFFLENATNTVEIPYQVKWRSRPTNGGATLTDGVPRNRGNANTTSELCTDALSSNMRIRIVAADLAAAPAGNYSAEVTIFVEPR